METNTVPLRSLRPLRLSKNKTAKDAERIEVRFNTQSFTENLCDLRVLGG